MKEAKERAREPGEATAPKAPDGGADHWLLRHRGLVLGVAAAITLALGAFLPRLGFDFSPQQLFETGDPDAAWARYERVIEAFGRDDNTLFVVLDAGPGGDALSPELRAWARKLSREAERWPFVQAVVSLATATTVHDEGGEITVGRADDLSAEAIVADPLLSGSLVSADRRYQV
ncbi:MAG: hypothetical protein D6729_08510, partial [Deltaproteobacteria bacterium]